MIKHHPKKIELYNYVAGQLSPANSLIVGAHLEMCSQCKTLAERLFDEQVARFDESETFDCDNTTFSRMFDSIVEATESCNHESVQTTKRCQPEWSLSLEGKKFELPETLQRLAFTASPWSKYVGKLWQSNVALGGRNLANFIYLENGGGVPEHTHGGNELTLVIDGTFEDENGCYRAGDFIRLNKQHTHTPISTDDGGCLVFSILDKPLSFTTGWARLINPLSHLYFQVNTDR